jgi:hypothetical protein
MYGLRRLWPCLGIAGSFLYSTAVGLCCKRSKAQVVAPESKVQQQEIAYSNTPTSGDQQKARISFGGITGAVSGWFRRRHTAPQTKDGPPDLGYVR